MTELSQLSYALDTFYILICAVLVMWMAAGFAMLEAGLVRAKNTAEILTKNIALFAIACTLYTGGLCADVFRRPRRLAAESRRIDRSGTFSRKPKWQ